MYKTSWFTGLFFTEDHGTITQVKWWIGGSTSCSFHTIFIVAPNIKKLMGPLAQVLVLDPLAAHASRTVYVCIKWKWIGLWKSTNCTWLIRFLRFEMRQKRQFDLIAIYFSTLLRLSSGREFQMWIKSILQNEPLKLN